MRDALAGSRPVTALFRLTYLIPAIHHWARYATCYKGDLEKMVGWRVTIRTLALGTLAAIVAHGQTVLNDAEKIADARKLFDALPDDHSGCEVFPLTPHFLFSLRVQAGYLARLPLAESQAQGRQWVVLTRITPKGGRGGGPVYLSQVAQLPNGEEPRIEGSYWLGQGRYAVKFLMFDGIGDVCRKDWAIDARLNLGVTRFKPILAAGEVGGSRGTGGVGAAVTKSVGRLTILLHAASVLQMQTLLSTVDKAVLLDGLVALMEELPGREVRLVVFNLEQRRELLRKDGFTFEALPEVIKALDALQPAAVDYRAVQNPDGTRDFIENLLNQEMNVSQPSGAVVLLGPKSIYRGKPSPQFSLPPTSKQRFFYLVWGGQGQNLPNHGADSIEYAVKQLKGKTMQVDSAATFAGAVVEIIRLSGMTSR